ncbi:MAG: indole-3-glycerol-phosphate synthase, partial [Spirochaetes bacterium]|nr:indole-3-glycerol-phosphate synthase [Spirochaetota bacterium]
DDHLVSVRKASGLPVLRKDFIFDPYQVRESWALGADCILLIAAILSGDQIKELAHYAQELKMEVLLEAHNEEELQKVLSVPSGAVGINSRNLKNFTTDLDTAKNLCRMIPADRIAVAESGIHSSQDGVDLLKTGFRAFLVGEYFIKSEDRQSCVRNFVDAVS